MDRATRHQSRPSDDGGGYQYGGDVGRNIIAVLVRAEVPLRG